MVRTRRSSLLATLGAASRILLLGEARQHGQGGKDGVGQVRVRDRAPAQILEERAGIGERASFLAVLLGGEDTTGIAYQFVTKGTVERKKAVGPLAACPRIRFWRRQAPLPNLIGD